LRGVIRKTRTILRPLGNFYLLITANQLIEESSSQATCLYINNAIADFLIILNSSLNKMYF